MENITSEASRHFHRHHLHDEQLSSHFTLSEFTRSGTAIRRGISNIPTPSEIAAMRQLCLNVLEPLRQRFGRIIITSGFRCPKLNMAVGGVCSSQHLRGEAADIYVTDKETRRKYAAFIMSNTPYDQMVIEPRWIHVSYTTRHKPRHLTVDCRKGAPIAHHDDVSTDYA